MKLNRAEAATGAAVLKNDPEVDSAGVENRLFAGTHLFYIDDGDMVSKRTFAVLQILLSLTESGETARGPVVSISN